MTRLATLDCYGCMDGAMLGARYGTRLLKKNQFKRLQAAKRLLAGATCCECASDPFNAICELHQASVGFSMSNVLQKQSPPLRKTLLEIVLAICAPPLPSRLRDM